MEVSPMLLATLFSAMERIDGDSVCSICLNELDTENTVVTPCGHPFCQAVLYRELAGSGGGGGKAQRGCAVPELQDQVHLGTTSHAAAGR
ncbi:hypothetical protein HMI54_010438 [Coelomomyces lativittatus]|nr:hypothetical protein HMI54_010438 [Coelomomyces lativittatus]